MRGYADFHFLKFKKMEKKIAVITGSIKSFEAWVRNIYESLPPDKSLIICETHKLATIEHPCGEKTKYIPITTREELQGITFDGVEKTQDWFFLTNADDLFDYACMRILGS
jgi:hypothetical protein